MNSHQAYDAYRMDPKFMPLENGEIVDGKKQGPWIVFLTNDGRRSESAYRNG